MNSLESLAQTQSDRLSRLSGIPLDIVLQHLDLASFTDLRLTSRQLSTNTIHSRFFRSAKTDLSLDSLHSLRDRAYHPQLGPVLRELTVVATLFDSQPAEATVQTRKKWSGFDKDELSRDTENYRQRVENLRERNVSCTDEEVQEAQRDLEWINTRIEQDTSTDVGQTPVSSQVAPRPAHQLSITNGTDPPTRTQVGPQSGQQHLKPSASSLQRYPIFRDTPLCSVQMRHVDDQLRTLGSEGFRDACKNIKSFGLSFSTYALIETPPIQGECLFRHAFAAEFRYKLGQYLESGVEDFTGAATILGYMPNITSLDLHLHHSDNLLLPEYTRTFAHISQNIRLGCLRELSLRGLPLRQDDIVLFLTNHPTIKKLCLDGILLVGGPWSPVFSCIETMPSLENLHLRSLSTEYHHVTNLDPVLRTLEVDLQDKEKWVACGDGHILHTRDMCREEIRQGLDFRPQPGPRNIWRDDTLAYFDRIQYEFGPPSRIWEWDPLNEDM
ncbi:unnamed protein product [Fusarium fujikuroi]|nr:hypothetical protein CEK25_002709 [Fusarium fujikuroi]VZI16084.1 unnamed protein product [Fusarium fujikuroi]